MKVCPKIAGKRHLNDSGILIEADNYAIDSDSVESIPYREIKSDDVVEHVVSRRDSE